MMKRSLATFAFTAALALGGLALASADASAQVAGRGSPPPTPGAPPTAGMGGGDDVIALILKDAHDCTNLAAVKCGPRKPVRAPLPAFVHCVDVAHPHYVLTSGQVVIDQRKSKVPFCDALHTLQ